MKIFVYGTLRRNCVTGAHDIYLRGARFIDYAKIRARLYLVNYYPALVLSEKDEWVVGEVYELVNEDQLRALDVYEECAEPFNSMQEYRREQVNTVLQSGENLFSYVYVYNRSYDKLIQIMSGDFLKPNE